MVAHHLFLFLERERERERDGVVWSNNYGLLICSLPLCFLYSVPGRETIKDSVASAGQLCYMVKAQQTTQRSKHYNTTIPTNNIMLLP